MLNAAKTRDNLPVYGVRQKKLAIYTTQIAEKQKGVSRMPLALARLTDEDILDMDKLILKKEDSFQLTESLINSFDNITTAFCYSKLRKSLRLNSTEI